jgi:type II secretory pathway pseudopilin PulG
MRKSAFTLIELLVYIAIMGFIIVVAGRVFSDSTAMRVRSQNMIKTAEEVGKVANLISEDISQMGVKAWGGASASSGNANYIISQIPEVYMDIAGTDPATHDSSSFRFFRGNATSDADGSITFDSLIFRKADIDENGEFLGVREISWAVNENGELHRRCRTVASNGGNPSVECPSASDVNEVPEVFIANNIKRFSFYASAPGLQPENPQTPDIAEDIVFPIGSNSAFKLLSKTGGGNVEEINFEYNDTKTIAEVSRFSAKNKFDNPSQDDRSSEVYLADNNANSFTGCLPVPIRDGETYIVEFDMPFLVDNSNILSEEARKDSSSTQFQPGVDHIAVGLRYSDGSKINQISPDVLLYAPQSKEADKHPRYAEFSAKGSLANKNVCVVLTFAFYSPSANQGKLRFTNFKVYRKQTGAYHFVKNDNNYNLDFANKYADENHDNDKLKHKKAVKAFELLLEIDKNGEVAGTYSKGSASTGMAILVPNNGGTYR